LCLTMLSTFSVMSFVDLDRFNYHFWIPGEILSEILVRTIFGCLVRFLGSLNNQKWFAPKFHSKFCQESKNDSKNGLAQKMTKLRKYWAWLNKTFDLQYFWLNDFMCQLKGNSSSQQIYVSWEFAEMTV